MKKLLNTLYISQSNRYLSLDGENIVVYEDKDEIGRVPLHNLEAVVSYGYTGASPALMYACAQKNVSICFMSQSGGFMARVVGETCGNVSLRKRQYLLSENMEESTRIARNFIIGKIYNARWTVERCVREHGMRLDVDKLKRVSVFLQTAVKSVGNSENLDVLRGIEGEAASVYFSVFDDFILQQKEMFVFKNRNRRPPLDRVNALLSYTYTLLAHTCAGALEAVGLDPYVGFLHRDRPGRTSLALDLMEELRAVLADRFVLSLINKRIVSPDGFKEKENGAIIMEDETKKTVLAAWQNRKQEMLTHPFLEEKVEWGMIPYVQALLLARYLRGDLDEYPPFMWK